MKKITLLISLMIVSLGFSQVPKIDFETDGASSIKALNLSTSTIVTGTGTNTTKVASLLKGANAYESPFEIILKNQISFSTIGAKTITFDFYQATATARPILVQVAAGTGDLKATQGYEVQVTTAATAGWQTLSFNFAAARESFPNTGLNKNIVGSYKKMYIFIDFGLAPVSTTAIDNIGGGTQGTIIPVDPAPTIAAPTPTPVRNSVDVISLFSNAYTNKTIDTWSEATDDSSIEDVVIAGNDTKKISFVNYLQVQFTGAGKHIDSSPMTNFHIDIWTPTATLNKIFNLKFSNFGGGSKVVNSIELNVNNASVPALPDPNPGPGKWISLDIPITDIPSLRNDLAELIITSDLGLVYVDNIYFWRDALPPGTPTICFGIPPKINGTTSFTLMTPIITTNSTGAFTFSSSNTDVATVSGNIVTLKGVGTTTITANQAATVTYPAGGTKTATFDVHPVAATTPKTSASTVIPLYSETYTVTGYKESFGPVSTVDLDPTSGVNNALKVDFNKGGYVQYFTTKDISTMQYVHFDYYTTDATTFSFSLISDAPFEAIYPMPEILKNQWVSVNIPMATFKAFSGFNAAKFIQFKFGTAALTPGTVYFDNLYFSLTDPALGTQNFETSKVSMYPNPVKNTLNLEAKGSIERVAVYSILGQEVMSKSPKSNATTLQTSGLQKGTYIVKSTIDGKTATSKFIKE